MNTRNESANRGSESPPATVSEDKQATEYLANIIYMLVTAEQP